MREAEAESNDLSLCGRVVVEVQAQRVLLVLYRCQRDNFQFSFEHDRHKSAQESNTENTGALPHAAAAGAAAAPASSVAAW